MNILKAPLLKPEMSLRNRIKLYKKRIEEIKVFLDKKPHEWGRFQSEFNQEINGIFRDLMIFERDSLIKNEEDKVYRLKQFFVEKFRQDFVKGDCLVRSLTKPRGYAGDYKIIDEIYKNDPRTEGYLRLYDNYYQMSAICNAVRNRKEDFKRFILEAVKTSAGRSIKIMDLASGPCRDVSEVLNESSVKEKDVTFHCYENDEEAIEYAGTLLSHNPRVVFFKQNAVRIALKNKINDLISDRYDFIFSTGLFDYLDERISVRLISNLKKLLKPGGILAISDVRDKFSNPSIYFMEWVADWSLIYREDDNFRKIFLDAGFDEKNLQYRYEQQGVMQYVIAKNRA